MGTPHLLWMDLETTGLDQDQHTIAEIAAIITDFDLNEKWLFSSPITLSQEDIDNGSEWCLKQHTTSGLYQRCLDQSLSTYSMYAFAQIESAVKSICGEEKPYLAGNSIHFDRSFLRADGYAQRLMEQINYRQIDVSSVKVLAQQWRPGVAPTGPKPHRALDDLRGSIEELKLYRHEFFSPRGLIFFEGGK